MPKLRTGASESGFHWLDLWNNCQWKGFLRSVLGLEPKHKAVALIFGSAHHYAKAVFYVKRNKVAAVKAARAAVKDAEAELEPNIDAERLAWRAETLIDRWVDQQGARDLNEFRVECVEKELRLPIPGLDGFFFTVRIDAGLRSKETGVLEIRETKTAGNSPYLTLDALELGDQVTAYTWACLDGLKEHPRGIVPDVSYWNKNTVDPSKIEFLRGAPILRQRHDIVQFWAGVAQRYSELSQKIAAFESGRGPEGLFPRNTHYCVAYGRRCEYADVCRDSRLPDGYVPPGFVRKNKVPLGSLGEETWDSSLES